ncbi:MAG: GGDEF domain-containing protein [Magnetococcales bacterium]|nr:GGDEF domain-containing protein [Magnetococcales bacterium]NGZ05540.1 GGDEF domain-containing protein [Magnetococcales bacterium]
MGISISLENRRKLMIDPALFAQKPRALIEEIEEYRKETERLGRIYELHRQLGTTLDLDSMIDAFSRWLIPVMPHNLVAYRRFGRRMHTACSCHGPDRQLLQELAQELLNQPITDKRSGDLPSVDRYYHLWPLDPHHEDCLLVIHPCPEISTAPFLHLEEEILEELRGPLERALAYEDLYDQARRDALTGLVNRRVFEERAAMEMAHAHRDGRPLALACLDLDHFKAINDRLGHGEGDAVLQTVSRTFARIVRDSDLLARIGGDEFAMILPNTPLDKANLLMERLCNAVRALDIHAPGSAPLGVSVGLALWQPHQSLQLWWESADAALYRAKAAGRSQVSY